jgi:dienelactone hydrolase
MNVALGALLLAAAVSSPAAVVTRRYVARDGRQKVELFEAFDDARKGPLPGVLVFHNVLEGVNGYIQAETKRLAELGYLAVAPTLATGADFGGLDDPFKFTGAQAEQYQRLLAERSSAALALMRKDPRLAAGKVALVGYCHLGGPAAMNLARRGEKLAGVATLWGGVSPWRLSTTWSRQKIEPKLLVMLGGQDKETNPYLASFEDEMRQAGADWRLVVYGPARHGFTIPGYKAERGEFHAESARLAWIQLSQFLEDVFR